MSDSCRDKDLAGHTWSFAFMWGIPLVAAIVGSFLSPMPRTVVLATALFWAGGGCLLNATRCGRLHCFITGPLFVLAAVAILLDGFNVATLPGGWILVAVVGGTCLAYHLESYFSTKYVGSSHEK